MFSNDSRSAAREGCKSVRKIHRICRNVGSGAALAIAAAALSGCASLGASGPSSASVAKAEGAALAGAHIALVDVTDTVARRVIAAHRSQSFAEVFGDLPPPSPVIGRGDTLDISIWEAPPAALFGTVVGSMPLPTSTALAPATMQSSTLPPQMVMEDGTISVPFAGSIQASGRSVQELERAIVARLRGKAHLPQVMVRVTGNRSASVTVVGDVATSTPVSLTPKGERLLDALAGAGGVKQPTGKMTLRLTRGTRSVSQSMESVLLDPSQNIYLRPGDVVTALFQPFTFTALGAVGTNAEVSFEGTGLTLAQALGRIGGLQDNRANVRGVFIFRLESPEALGISLTSGQPLTPDGRVPVIYKVNLGDPASFFVAQSFPIRNGDILYVSNAPLADLQKFVTIVSSMAYSIIGIGNAVQ